MKNERFQSKIKKNILLKDYSTFKIGGPAKYFFEARTKNDLIKAIKWAKENKLPFFVLGGGSNLLFSDKGFNGLIIKFKAQNLKLKTRRQNSKLIEAEAGVELNDLVKLSVNKGLSGLEWAAGIPGTIGGAVFGNAAAFGRSISENVVSIDCLEIRPQKIISRTFKGKNCHFGLKETIFKKNKNIIILSASLKVRKGGKEKIKQQIEEHLAYRERHPREPSAGCIFRNEKLKIKDEKLLKGFPEFEKIKESKIIPSALLIEKAGLKGKRLGGAMVSLKHANFIINLGQAKSKDVLQLIKLIKNKVRNKFGINLKEELNVIKTR